MTLLLMAAGSGSRYGKLKQFDDLGPKGEFLMEFAMYDAIKNDFNHIVVITKKENVDFLKNHLIYLMVFLLTVNVKNPGGLPTLYGQQEMLLMVRLR